MNFYRRIPTITSTQVSQLIKEIDLNNYYRHDPERQIINCQICKLDILSQDIFVHTVSKRHKYNKLFFAILKGCCQNVDLDFIVLDIDELQCRYCHSLVINSDKNDLVISHIQDTLHIKNKQECLIKINASSSRVLTEYKLLQPLDSFITHDMKYRKCQNKLAKKIEMKKNSLQEKPKQVTKELTGRNNVDPNIDPEYLAFCRDYQIEWGEELPKFIRFGKKPTCTCTICHIEIPKCNHNIVEHIDGKKHQTNMLTETKKEITPVAQKLEVINAEKKLSAEPVKLLKYCRMEETVKDFEEISNIFLNNGPQGSAFFGDKEPQSEKKLSDCISIGVDGVATCTVCLTGIPNTSKNINEHLNGKRHTAMLELSELKKQPKLKLQNVKKLIPAPVSKVVMDKEPQSAKKLSDCISIGVDGVATCTVCLTGIPNTSKNINEHLNGKRHTAMLELSELKKQPKLKLQNVNKLIPAPVSKVVMDKEPQSAKKLSDCFSIGEDGVHTCIVCLAEIPNTSEHINAHLNGKRHTTNNARILESKEQLKLKLQNITKLIPAPVSKVEKGTIMCTTCVVMVPNYQHCIKQHNDSKNHKKKMLHNLMNHDTCRMS